MSDVPRFNRARGCVRSCQRSHRLHTRKDVQQRIEQERGLYSETGRTERGWNARTLDREVGGPSKRKTLEQSGRFYICFGLWRVGANFMPQRSVGSLQQHLWTVSDPPPEDLIPDNAQQGGKKQTGCNAKGGGRCNSHSGPFTLIPYCQRPRSLINLVRVIYMKNHLLRCHLRTESDFQRIEASYSLFIRLY